jgi:hypothetical protein
MAQAAVCSKKNTKHINTVWKERTIIKIHGVSKRALQL